MLHREHTPRGAVVLAHMKESVIQRAVELNDPDLAKEALREIDVLLSSSSDGTRESIFFSAGHPATEYWGISQRLDGNLRGGA